MERGFAERYGTLQRWHWWFRGRQRIVETVVRAADPGSRSRAILAAGGGPAEGLSWLVPLAGAGGMVVGLDVERVHAGRRGDAVAFVVGRLEEAPLRPASHDVVLALDVIEHLDDDTAGLRAAAAVLRPGGLLVVTVPALPSLWGVQDEVNQHRRRYTRGTLHAAFARAGLPRPAVSYFNTLLFPPIAVVRWLRRAVRAPGTTRSDFEDNRPGPLNDALAAVFGLERLWVGRLPVPFGVSLLATMRAPDGAMR